VLWAALEPRPRPLPAADRLPGAVTVASMCAIDALGIPEMLGCDAVIDAADPVSGEPVLRIPALLRHPRERRGIRRPAP